MLFRAFFSVAGQTHGPPHLVPNLHLSRPQHLQNIRNAFLNNRSLRHFRSIISHRHILLVSFDSRVHAPESKLKTRRGRKQPRSVDFVRGNGRSWDESVRDSWPINNLTQIRIVCCRTCTTSDRGNARCPRIASHDSECTDLNENTVLKETVVI
jgi:hypothetical protein